MCEGSGAMTKPFLCRVGFHRWQRIREELLYGDARMMADFLYTDRCDRCGIEAQFMGRERNPQTAG